MRKETLFLGSLIHYPRPLWGPKDSDTTEQLSTPTDPCGGVRPKLGALGSFPVLLELEQQSQSYPKWLSAPGQSCCPWDRRSSRQSGRPELQLSLILLSFSSHSPHMLISINLFLHTLTINARVFSQYFFISHFFVQNAVKLTNIFLLILYGNFFCYVL